jgi:hypothetical protein
MILRYSLASVAFFLGLFLAFRAAPPPAPVEAREVVVDKSFEASWARRVGPFCKPGSVVISRCTVDTLPEMVNPEELQSRQRAERSQGLLTRRQPDSVQIWIRER